MCSKLPTERGLGPSGHVFSPKSAPDVCCWDGEREIGRDCTGPGNPGKPWKILKPWKSLETLEKPWNFFMKPWKISQNFIEKINSSNGAFSGLNNEHLEVTGHSGQWLSRFTGPDSKSTGPAKKSKEANSISDGCVSMGILPSWIWISMCMANVVLASWFPADACLYWNMWSYYFRILNGFSFGKYFFQSYFPWQKRFNE